MIDFLIGGANLIIQSRKKKRNQNKGNQGGNQGHQNWGNGSNTPWSNQGSQNQGWNQGQQRSWGNGLGIQNQQNQQQWGNNYNGSQWAREQQKRNQFNIVNPGQNVNLGKMLADQITFIEPSPVQKKLQQLRRTGQPFIDESFPPNQQSLVGEYGMQSDWTSIRWQRISDVVGNVNIFKDKPSPCDIQQGYLGDCYFLAGLAALAERPDRIFNLFLMQEMNQQKYFSVKMLYKGKWMTVDMDEYVPVLNGKPAFSKCVGESLWVVLLEKAWAKLYTSYKRIQAGYPEEAIHDLTGAPIRQITFKSASFDKEQQWQYLLQASAREYSMVASSLPGSDTQKSMKGVVQGHAYTLLNAAQLNYNGRIQRIVELRNPWGKGQWSGKWSDQDPNWNNVHPSQRQRIGFSPDGNDGLFWMPYDEFIAQFRALTVAEIDDQASYVYKSTKDKQLNGVYFAIDILQEGVYSFHVDKTPERIYPEKHQEIFRYPDAIFEIGRVEGNSVKKFQGLRSARRTLFKKETLTPGRYVAYVKISYDRDFEDQFDVNLAVYSQTPCNVQLATREQAIIYSGNPSVQWTGEDMSSNQPWNSQGNSQMNGNNGFNQGNQGGWGNQQPPQQQGWNQQPPQNSWDQSPQQGWGGQQPQQEGWGQQQGGWGNQQPPQGAWGQQAPQGAWGNQQTQGAWGQQPPQQQGWNQPPQQPGWGGQRNNGW